MVPITKLLCKLCIFVVRWYYSETCIIVNPIITCAARINTSFNSRSMLEMAFEAIYSCSVIYIRYSKLIVESGLKLLSIHSNIYVKAHYNLKEIFGISSPATRRHLSLSAVKLPLKALSPHFYYVYHSCARNYVIFSI